MERTADGKGKNISENHPIFVSRLWSSPIFTRLRGKVLGLNTMGKCTLSDITATGIPEHLELARKYDELKERFEKMIETMQENHNDLKNNLPGLVAACLQKNITATGVKEMTRDELESVIRDIFNKRDQELAAASTATTTALTVSPNVVNYFSLDNKGYGSWCWGGKLNRFVPQDFVFPKCPVKAMADLFVFGMNAQTIRPFRMFHATGLESKIDKANFCKANFVFNCVVSVALAHEYLRSKEELALITPLEWDRVFNDAFILLLGQISLLGKSIKKPGELSYLSLYDYCKELYNGYMTIDEDTSSVIASVESDEVANVEE